MGVDRIARLSEEMRKEISLIIQNEIKDPRVPLLTSVTHVDVTRDLRYAKAYISVYGEKEQKEKCIEGLKSAAGYIRREVGGRIKMRYTPELIFQIDDSIEHGLNISRMIKEMKKE